MAVITTHRTAPWRLLLVAGLALAALAAGSGAVAGADADEAASAALLERIAAAHRAVTGVQGQATWRTRHGDEPASAARVQEVQFALLFPDQYRLVFTTPGDADTRLVVRCDGVRREELQYQFKDEPPDRKLTPVDHQDPEFARLLSCFRLDLPALERDFAVHAAATPGGATLTFAPARPAIAEQVASLAVQLDAAFRITQLAWSDPQGNRYQVTIDHADYDTPISPATFHIGPPGP